MREYFKINNQFRKYLPVFLIMLSLILLLGTSYALIKNGNKGENTYVVNVGSLEITFIDSETDNLVLDNVVPMTDVDGMNQTDELSVTIKNTGGFFAKYNMYMEETSTDIDFKSQIRYSVNKNNAGYNSIKTLGEDKYVDLNGELSASETATYKIKVWLSETADSSYMNKSFSAKLVVEIVRNVESFSDTIRAVLNTKTATTYTDTAGTIYISGSTNLDGTVANTDVDYNYVWYSGKLWRITALYPDNTIKLVTEGSMVSMDLAKNVTYKDSFTDQWLNQEFLSTLYNYRNMLVMDSEWNVTTATSYTAMPAKTTIVKAPVGMLNGYEYYNSYRKATAATSYLNTGHTFWIGTQYNTADYVYITAAGAISHDGVYDASYGIRPAIILKNGIEIKSGDGTLTNPYRLYGDNPTAIVNTTLLNERSSGEYVTFNDILFRIVETDDNYSTKLVTDDYLKNGTSVLNKYFTKSGNVYGNGTSTSYWDYYLNNTWYNTFDTTEKSMMTNGTYYVGQYGDTGHYKDAICSVVDDRISAYDCRKTGVTTWTGKVGTLRVGEMFASQQKSSHNDTLQIYYTMTNYTSGTQRRTVATSGLGYKTPSSATHAIRPTIHIIKDVKITGGLGTKENPYTIGL